MICTTCQHEGTKSRVFARGTYSTLMASTNYWDEDGNAHWHNPNERLTRYACSNGHEWHEVEDNECDAPGCSWSRKNPHA